jgi:hypothetical protein
MSDLISSNLADAQMIRSDLTEADPDGNPLFVKRVEVISGSIKQITATKRYYGDSMAVDDGTGSYPNAFIYDANQSFTIDDMNVSGSWSSVGGVPVKFTQDTSGARIWTLSGGLQVAWASGSGTVIIRSTQNYGNFSAAVSGSANTPKAGTGGVWAFTQSGAIITNFKAKFGSSSVNYHQYSGGFYGDLTYYVSGGKNLLLFDMNQPATSGGAVDWTSIVFTELQWDVNSGGYITLDKLSVSKNDNICSTGVGDRKVSVVQWTQGVG